MFPQNLKDEYGPFINCTMNNLGALLEVDLATSLLDLLLIELMLHLSHEKQMYSQTMHLTHELKLCIQMIRRRVSLTEIPRWRILAGAEFQTATFRPRFLALQPHLPYRVLAIFMAPHGRAHSSGQCSGGPHWSDHQQVVAFLSLLFVLEWTNLDSQQ